MKKTYKLRAGAHEALVEALRRFIFFAVLRDGMDWNLKDLTNAWTGLGPAPFYKAAQKSGLMEIATKPNPGQVTWWKLTKAGAKILLYWKETSAFEAKDYAIVRIPPREIPFEL